ncbi:peptide ABC transporter substrate-binding protein [Pediococcus siamensis]|uniref:peptide ABC transporter substrate-binding protein n=1 Tax=Pediococcus siamensis TaxID=381829 RepID=UPI00399EF245
MKKQILAMSAILFSGILFAGCSAGKADSNPETINVTLAGNPATADPNKGGDTNSGSLFTQTDEGLYKLNKNQKVVAGVATKVVQPTNNGKTYTFKIKKDARWSNGKAITAQDFVTSFQRQVDPKTKSQVANLLTYVKNYQAVQDGKVKPSALGVKALNKKTLQIQLSKPEPYLKTVLATSLYPVYTSYVKKYGSSYGSSSQKIVSSGAYKLVGWDATKDSWTYKKNPYYWNAKQVKLSKINVQVVKDDTTAINLFKGNKVQETAISGQTVSQFANSKNLNTHLISRMAFLEFNYQHKATSNENLSKAISLILNRKTMTTKVLADGSIPALNMVPKGDATDEKSGKDFATTVGNLLSYNVSEAQKDWQRAQKQLGKKKLTLTMLVDNTATDKQVGQYIQGQAKKYLKGLTITIKPMPHAQHIGVASNGDYDINLDGWTGDNQDPEEFLQLGNGQDPVNFTKWADKHYTKLMNEIDDTNHHTTSERWALMQEADKYLMAKQGIVPLYQSTATHLVSKDVKGLTYSNQGGNALYQYASVK